MSWFNRQNNSESEDEQGGSYLVSVSDMMCGLLFIFIITLMVFVLNFHEEKSKAEQEAQGLKQTQQDLTDARQARRELLQGLERSLKKDGVMVHVDEDKGLLHIPEEILFASGQAEIQAKGKQQLAKLAQHLAKVLPCYTGKRGTPCPEVCSESTFHPGRIEAVFVEGHTDNVPISNSRFADNWDLSAKRGIVTYQYLLQMRPELGELKNQDDEALFGVSGYAHTRPVNTHQAVTSDPQNRRIDLRFLLASPSQADAGGQP